MSIKITIGMLLCILSSTTEAAEAPPVVIAHRGASGYLPEHTLAAKAMAYAMHVDFLEQDIVLTKDGCPIVLHDIYVDTVTNVDEVFPSRKRAGGRYYAIDFTLEEIKQLRVHERVHAKSKTAVYDRRFPVGRSSFQIPTLSEEIELIQGLNRSTGRDVGLYPEVKSPAWHHQQGQDISKVVLGVLRKYGYHRRTDNAYLQCFDSGELRRIRNQLGSRLKLIQLLRDDCDEQQYTVTGLADIATYADGIGPPISCVVSRADASPGYSVGPVVRRAHQQHLAVHVYTLRADVMPDFANSFDRFVEILIRDANTDGLFTDFPDQTVAVRDRLIINNSSR